jgi:hypothetical protein
LTKAIDTQAVPATIRELSIKGDDSTISQTTKDMQASTATGILIEASYPTIRKILLPSINTIALRTHPNHLNRVDTN